MLPQPNNSIFHSVPYLEEEDNIWQTQTEIEQAISTKNTNPPLALTAFKKSSKNPDMLSERYFFVIKNYLCYKTSLESTKYSGIMNLNLMSAKFGKRAKDLDENLLFQVKFIRGLKSCSIYFYSMEDYTTFVEEIRKYVVFRNFYKVFKPMKFIAGGSFGNVNF